MTKGRDARRLISIVLCKSLSAATCCDRAGLERAAAYSVGVHETTTEPADAVAADGTTDQLYAVPPRLTGDRPGLSWWGSLVCSGALLAVVVAAVWVLPAVAESVARQTVPLGSTMLTDTVSVGLAEGWDSTESPEGVPSDALTIASGGMVLSMWVGRSFDGRLGSNLVPALSARFLAGVDGPKFTTPIQVETGQSGEMVRVSNDGTPWGVASIQDEASSTTVNFVFTGYLGPGAERSAAPTEITSMISSTRIYPSAMSPSGNEPNGIGGRS